MKSLLTSVQAPHMISSCLPSFSHHSMLLWLGKSTQPDAKSKFSFRKATLCQSVIIMPNSFLFTLPTHKSDWFFDGSTILIEFRPNQLCHHKPFICYLAARDTRFPYHAHLWLHSTGQIPTYSWVIQQLKSALGSDAAGHSICLGGATALALAGTPDDHTQACGRWSSQVYQTYIWRHPNMLWSLLHSWSAFNLSPWTQLSSSLHHHSPPIIISLTIFTVAHSNSFNWVLHHWSLLSHMLQKARWFIRV